MDNESEPTIVCENCDRPIPESKSFLHEAYCLRNVIRCPKCNEPVDKSEMENHENEAHTLAPCQYCKKHLEKNQVETHEETCTKKPKKPIFCNYCNCDINADEYTNHAYHCGSRTKKCPFCNKNILVKDYDNHEVACEINQQNYAESFPAMPEENKSKATETNPYSAINSKYVSDSKSNPYEALNQNSNKVSKPKEKEEKKSSYDYSRTAETQKVEEKKPSSTRATENKYSAVPGKSTSSQKADSLYDYSKYTGERAALGGNITTTSSQSRNPVPDSKTSIPDYKSKVSSTKPDSSERLRADLYNRPSSGANNASKQTSGISGISKYEYDSLKNKVSTHSSSKPSATGVTGVTSSLQKGSNTSITNPSNRGLDYKPRDIVQPDPAVNVRHTPGSYLDREYLKNAISSTTQKTEAVGNRPKYGVGDSKSSNAYAGIGPSQSRGTQDYKNETHSRDIHGVNLSHKSRPEVKTNKDDILGRKPEYGYKAELEKETLAKYGKYSKPEEPSSKASKLTDLNSYKNPGYKGTQDEIERHIATKYTQSNKYQDKGTVLDTKKPSREAAQRSYPTPGGSTSSKNKDLLDRPPKPSSHQYSPPYGVEEGDEELQKAIQASLSGHSRPESKTTQSRRQNENYNYNANSYGDVDFGEDSELQKAIQASLGTSNKQRQNSSQNKQRSDPYSHNENVYADFHAEDTELQRALQDSIKGSRKAYGNQLSETMNDEEFKRVLQMSKNIK